MRYHELDDDREPSQTSLSVTEWITVFIWLLWHPDISRLMFHFICFICQNRPEQDTAALTLSVAQIAQEINTSGSGSQLITVMNFEGIFWLYFCEQKSLLGTTNYFLWQPPLPKILQLFSTVKSVVDCLVRRANSPAFYPASVLFYYFSDVGIRETVAMKPPWQNWKCNTKEGPCHTRCSQMEK